MTERNPAGQRTAFDRSGVGTAASVMPGAA